VLKSHLNKINKIVKQSCLIVLNLKVSVSPDSELDDALSELSIMKLVHVMWLRCSFIFCRILN